MDRHTLASAFADAFPGTEAPAFCRAPGRVNLIGEHTDYNGLPVLPMALAEEICVAFAPLPDRTIRLRDAHPEFPPISFDNDAAILPSGAGAWENYCKAAIQAVNTRFKPRDLPGMALLVESNLPIAAGLSSSSALVVAFALAYLRVLGIRLGTGISRIELAELLAEGERYVGTCGGGMDQAVILNNAAGMACKIDFFPLRLERAPLPPGCAVVVCDSLVKVRKSGEALHRYNAGPRSCALACALVERALRETFDEELSLPRLGEMFFGPLCLTAREAGDLCREAVPEERTSLRAAAVRLGLSETEIRRRWLGDLPEPEGGFPLRARLRHLISEYRRVERARDALLAGDAAAFGGFMNESHASCANDFQISSPELDALTDIARAGGALGARLTGAGFGGATVNLVPEEALEAFTAHVTKKYYRERMERTGPVPIFTAIPSEGAGYCE